MAEIDGEVLVFEVKITFDPKTKDYHVAATHNGGQFEVGEWDLYRDAVLLDDTAPGAQWKSWKYSGAHRAILILKTPGYKEMKQRPDAHKTGGIDEEEFLDTSGVRIGNPKEKPESEAAQ